MPEHDTADGPLAARLAAAKARIAGLERALADAQSALTDFGLAGADWFWETGPDHRFTFMSQSVTAITGRTPAWHIGKLRAELNAAGASDPIWQAHVTQLARREPFRDLRYRTVLADGRAMWASVSGVPVFADTGRFLGYRGSASDVTARVEAEAALRLREQRYLDFAEVSSDWFWELDAELRFTYMSPTVQRVTGYPAQWHIGREPFSAMPPGPQRQAFRAKFAALDRREPFRNVVYSRRLDDGRVISVSMSGRPLFDASGAFAGYRGVGSDVTEQVRAEDDRALSEARLRTLLKHLPAAVMLKDLGGRILLANEAFARWHDTALEACVGALAADFTPPWRLAAAIRQDQDVLETRAAHAYAFEARDARGESRYMHTVRFPLLDGDGAVAAIGSIWTDITARKRAEERLEERSEALEAEVRRRTRDLENSHEQLVKQERMAALGQLTATVSHELRNPLGTIQTGVYALRRRLAPGDQAQLQTIARIERNIARCVRLIEELLSFGHARDLRLSTVDLDSWLTEVLRDTAVPPHVRVVVRLEAGVALDLDVDKMRQVIVNAINNACDAMSVDAVEGGRDALLQVSTGRLAGRVHMTFADAGCGMSEDTLRRVFEPLFSTKSFGFGLGMPLMLGIMEEHGGGVDVASKPGSGTTVTLWLPHVERRA